MGLIYPGYLQLLNQNQLAAIDKIMKKKLTVIVTVLILLAGFAMWFYVFQYSKTHHRNLDNETAINVSAKQIVADYINNEKTANSKYLNKAIEIQGEVLNWGKDQAGNNTVTLKTGDAFANVFCTFKSGEVVAGKEKTITIKGVCNGFLSDVILNDAVIVH